MRAKELIEELQKHEPEAVVGIEESNGEFRCMLAIHGKEGKSEIPIEEPCLDCFDHHQCKDCQNYNKFTLVANKTVKGEQE